jgi:hypothetical protein
MVCLAPDERFAGHVAGDGGGLSEHPEAGEYDQNI